MARLIHRVAGCVGGSVALVIGLFALSSCASDTVRQGMSPAYLVIDSIEAASGADPSTFSNYLQSDVVTGGGILEDPWRVGLHVELKNVTAVPTSNNTITVNRYRVVYKRADGRNTPGVDVPYPFDGGVTGSLSYEGNKSTFTFVLVRVQSKLEPPLQALRNLGGAIVISTLAEVTFYGHDQAGNEVAVTGSITVNFADWADPL